LVDNKLKFHEQCSAVIANFLEWYIGLLNTPTQTGFLLYYGPTSNWKIQLRATKLIPELRDLTYQEHLYMLSLPSLFYRCQRGEMIFLYQLTHHYFNINVSSLFEYQSSSTRGHRFKIYKPHAKCFCRSHFLQYVLLTTGTICQLMLWTYHLLTYSRILSIYFGLINNMITLRDCTGCASNP